MEKIINYATEERFVAFIDILGFKDIVMKNKNPEKIMIALETAKEKIRNKNFDVVSTSNFSLLNKDYRQDSLFPEYFDVACAVNDLDLEELKCDFEEFENLKITWFSDSLILSIKADELYNLLFLIEIVKNLQANLFNYKILLRGAITKGEFHHGDNAVYGKAMIDAYILESKKVVTPRIILSKELIKYIKSVDKKDSKKLDFYMTQSLQYDAYPNEHISSAVAEMWGYQETLSEELFNRVLINDTDGLYFIDYLKPLLYDIACCLAFDSSKFPTDKFLKSKTFINSEINNEDMAISLKYLWLKEYFNRSLKTVENLFNMNNS